MMLLLLHKPKQLKKAFVELPRGAWNPIIRAVVFTFNEVTSIYDVQ